MVISDSALTNTLKKMYRKSPTRLGGIIDLLYECYYELPSKNFIVEGMRILCIDGTTFAKHFATAALVLGVKFDYLLDIMGMRKRGKEVPTAIRLLRRIAKKIGKGCFDIVLYDGLCKYELIKAIRDIIGSEVLVKTKEERLDIIEDAELQIKGAENLKGEIEYKDGYDYGRMEYYRIWGVSNIKRSNSDDDTEYKVMRIEEYQIKIKEVRKKQKIEIGELKEKYWIITTNKDMELEMARRLCIMRWRIETKGFRQLNIFGKSKRKYSKYPSIALPLISLIALSHNLFLVFLQQQCSKINAEDGCKIWDNLKYYYVLLMENTYRKGGLSPPPLLIVSSFLKKKLHQ